MKKRDLCNILVIIFCMAFPFIALAQGPTDRVNTPINGGLSLLLAAGAA